MFPKHTPKPIETSLIKSFLEKSVLNLGSDINTKENNILLTHFLAYASVQGLYLRPTTEGLKLRESVQIKPVKRKLARKAKS